MSSSAAAGKETTTAATTAAAAADSSMTAVSSFGVQEKLQQPDKVAMVAIKNGEGAEGGGGHDAFNLARAIDAFSPRVLRYNGNSNDDVWQSMKVGGLLCWRWILHGVECRHRKFTQS